MPRNISKFVDKFSKLINSKLSCKVKGKRLNRAAGYGLEISVIYTFNGYEKAIEWIKSWRYNNKQVQYYISMIKSKIGEDIKLEQSMKNRCFK